MWTNTYLGESWEDAGEQVDDFSLYERREDYQEAVPEEVVFLTAGVDVQDNRLEASVIGWARDQESYVIDHSVMYGDPSTPQLWTQLDSLVNKTYETYAGRQMAIRACASILVVTSRTLFINMPRRMRESVSSLLRVLEAKVNRLRVGRRKITLRDAHSSQSE